MSDCAGAPVLGADAGCRGDAAAYVVMFQSIAALDEPVVRDDGTVLRHHEWGVLLCPDCTAVARTRRPLLLGREGPHRVMAVRTATAVDLS